MRKPISVARRLKLPVQSSVEAFSLDWIGLWAISLGIASCAIATLIYVTSGEGRAAAFALAVPAALIGLFLRIKPQSTAGHDDDLS
jgi:hypothetical protein